MLHQRLRLSLEPLREVERAKWQSAYLLNQFPFLGVRAPILRNAARAEFRAYTSVDWRKSTLLLWEQPEREFQYAAIEWALKHKKQWVEADLSLFEGLIRTKSWWDTVDTLAPHIIGPMVQRFPQLLAQMDAWMASDHLWLRRASILFQLRYKKKTDAERLFRTCEALGQEKEFFIRKAIGWALREYSKTDREAVRAFLDRSQLSSLSVREASKYLHNK